MTSPISSGSHSVHAQSAAPLSLLLDIPRDVLPNIFTRLPGPALLRLAQVCKQLPIENKQDMLKDWANRELLELGFLSGEQLWTRFLALVANCGHLIDSDTWVNFLAIAELHNEGHTMLLNMAALSFKNVGSSESVATLPRPAASEFNAKEYKNLSRLATGAKEKPWMERASAAAVTGLWRHAVRHERNVDWTSLESLVCKLPVMTQVRIMPSLDGHDCRDPRLLGPHGTLSKMHSVRLVGSVTCELPLKILANASPAYLVCLSKMFASGVNTSYQCQARMNLRCFVSQSLSNGMPLGAWRGEAPELALFVLLALEWDPEKQALEAGLGKQLLDCEFITRPEYDRFLTFFAKASGDRMNRVEQWLSLNRDKQVAKESESVCAIS